MNTRRPTGPALRRHDALRRLVAMKDLGELVVVWEVAADDPGRLAEQGLETAWNAAFRCHVHGETSVDGHHVHIDWVTRTSFSPARSLTEVCIHVDGEAAGQGYRGACSLGFGGSDLPAIARIGRSLAIVVDGDAERIVAFNQGGSLYYRADAMAQRPCVWLWEVASPRAGDARKWRVGMRNPRMFRD